MKKLLFILLLFTAVACDKGSTDALKTKIANAITDVATPAIVITLECSAIDTVKADVRAAIFKILKVDSKSLASGLCKSTMETIVPQLIGAAVNPAWGCTATNVQDGIRIITNAACSKL